MRHPHSITVRDLIELLEDEDPNAMVILTSNYGDYWRTQQVHLLRGQTEVIGAEAIEESAYSQSGWALKRGGNDDEDDDGDQRLTTEPIFVLLS